MVFTSNPLYVDPPNWQYHHHQQQQQQQVSLFGGGNEIVGANTMQHQPPAATGGSRTIRPGSMTDRARMAKLPLPDQMPLTCPRCESTNTKFCYFNNYSLTQPRHFCKTCRRYWTIGGALRNVPVGGGCRRPTKRSSKKRSKSASPAVSGTATATTTNSTDHQTLGSGSADQNGHNMMNGVGQFPFPPGTNQMGGGFSDQYIGGGNYGAAQIDPHDIARLLQTGGVASLADISTDQQWSILTEAPAAAAVTSTSSTLFPFMVNCLQQQHEHYSSPPSGLLYQFDQRGGHLGLSGNSSLDSIRNSKDMDKTIMESTAAQFTNVKMKDGNKRLRSRSLGSQDQAAASNNNITNNVNNQLSWVGTGGCMQQHMDY